MNHAAPLRLGPARRWKGVLLAALALGAALAGAPSPALAQAEQLLSEQELEYASAQREYESRRAAWEVQRSRFQNALNEVSAAKRSGDDGRLETAYQAVTVLSLELSRLRGRVDEALRALEGERRELLEALDQRSRALEDQFSLARSPEEQRGLAAQINDLQNQYEALAGEAGLRPTLVFWPEVDASPLDGQEELRAKVEILERQVREAVQEQARVDEEITRLEGRQRLERFAADARTSRDRFGDTNVPVGPPGRPDLEPGSRASADTTAVPLVERPLAQQIEALESYREQLDLMRSQLEARAKSIRNRLPRGQSDDL